MKELFIKTETPEQFKPIPKWAEFFVLAGKKVADITATDSENFIIGFSLPTKFYAALFFLLGYEICNAEKAMLAPEGNHSYFSYLSECEVGEALLILHNNRWKRCWFKGVETIANDNYIKVEVPGSNTFCDFIPVLNIFKLRKAVDPERSVAANQIGFELSGLDSLIQFYNKKESDILRFLVAEEYSYTLIGNISTLGKEIEHEKIYFSSKDKYSEISFQNILRFKNFMTDFDLARGIILSIKNSQTSPFDVSRAVIYDGSLAYLNHQGDIRSKTQIVFLDRTEPQFSTACSELMVQYFDRSDDVKLFDDIPDSVEVVTFKE